LVFGSRRFGTKYLSHLEASDILRLPNYAAQHRGSWNASRKNCFCTRNYSVI